MAGFTPRWIAALSAAPTFDVHLFLEPLNPELFQSVSMYIASEFPVYLFRISGVVVKDIL